MMKLCFTFFCFLLFSLTGFTQDRIGKITGTVSNENQQELEAVAVQLLNSQTNKLVKTEITNKVGVYEFVLE